MKESTTPKKSQVQIETGNLDAGKAIVDKILLMAVRKFDLYDNSHTSRVPDTIRSIVEGNGRGFGLGARVAKGSVFVDFNPIPNHSPKFKEVHDFVLDELQNAFRTDLHEIWEDDPVYFKTN